MTTAEQFIKLFQKEGIKQVFLRYRTQYDTAVHVLSTKTIQEVYEQDLEKLNLIDPESLTSTEREILYKKLNSLRTSLEKGIGNRNDYTNKDVYEILGNHIKRHRISGDLYVTAICTKKMDIQIIKPRSPLSVKAEMEKAFDKKFDLEAGKIRQYKISGDQMGEFHNNLGVFSILEIT